jgi:TetR/AcrR family transcriptional regulator, cholesterol catabolism regulator
MHGCASSRPDTCVNSLVLMASKSKRHAREEELVARAVQVFSRGGYQATSLQDIADELGITRPLFYYYFESKEDLLWRIIGHLGDHLLETARPIAASKVAAREKLPMIIEAHTRALLENVDAFRIYFAERHLLTGTRDRRIRRGERTYLELIERVIADGQAAEDFCHGDPRVLTRFLTGMANSVTRWYHESGTLDVDALSRLAGEISAAGVSRSGHEASAQNQLVAAAAALQPD